MGLFGDGMRHVERSLSYSLARVWSRNCHSHSQPLVRKPHLFQTVMLTSTGVGGNSGFMLSCRSFGFREIYSIWVFVAYFLGQMGEILVCTYWITDAGFGPQTCSGWQPARCEGKSEATGQREIQRRRGQGQTQGQEQVTVQGWRTKREESQSCQQETQV